MVHISEAETLIQEARYLYGTGRPTRNAVNSCSIPAGDRPCSVAQPSFSSRSGRLLGLSIAAVFAKFAGENIRTRRRRHRSGQNLFTRNVAAIQRLIHIGIGTQRPSLQRNATKYSARA